jgi:GAF domain-containing protein
MVTDKVESGEDGAVDPSEAFTALGRIVLGERSLDEVLDQVSQLARRSIEGADEVSVTLIRDEKTRTAAFTGEVALALDERQYEAGFGPCLDAAESGETFAISDTQAPDVPWTKFAAAAAAKGMRSTLSVGLPVQQRTIGALNLYSSRVDGFDDDAVQLATTFAGYGAVALANASLYESTADLARHMQQALHSRAVIDQAKGIIMARQHCSPEEAFLMLSQASQRSNRKLRDIAQAMVEAEGGASQQ